MTFKRSLFIVATLVMVLAATVVIRSLPGKGISGTPKPEEQPKDEWPAPTPKKVPYHGPVEHIFFHPLIAYPELSFDGDRLSRGYDDWFVTVAEFKRILDGLYNNGYVLVGMDDVLEHKVTAASFAMVPKELLLPEGKKPLIISIDDLNYYDYMRKNGNVWKLVVGEDGRVATCSVTPDGKENISYDNEIIPILDSFVRDHPEFSLTGSKGIIALTGYQGILGYRTNDRESAVSEREKEQALAVVNRLKQAGWSFACHGWGHLDMARVSYKTFVQDTDRWKKEVEPLVGQTRIYVYPFGSRVGPGTPKFQYLLDSGFRVFCAVGPQPWKPEKGPYALMDRIHVDGIALRTQRQLLAHLFNADGVLDSVRPPRSR